MQSEHPEHRATDYRRPRDNRTRKTTTYAGPKTLGYMVFFLRPGSSGGKMAAKKKREWTADDADSSEFEIEPLHLISGDDFSDLEREQEPTKVPDGIENEKPTMGGTGRKRKKPGSNDGKKVRIDTPDGPMWAERTRSTFLLTITSFINDIFY